MFMGKSRILKIILTISTVTWVALVLVLIYMFLWKTPTSKEVFEASQNFVVELKSNTGETLVTYGSAVIIDGNGTLVTNAHMVTYKQSGLYISYEYFEIRFSYEDEYRKVNLIKYDLNLDIAFLQMNDITDIKLKPSTISDSSKIHSGDIVYAVGNGLNHGIGITKGIVSLPQVNINYNDLERNVIQCDLIINDGNSGGALLNEYGELIGITTFRIKDSTGNPVYGIAFSVPINVAIAYLNTN
jgi:S1-C subfamily serine protease